MSGYPISKRQHYPELHKQHTPRLLAHRHLVQHRLHLEQNNSQYEQDTDAQLQDPATVQSDIPASSDHVVKSSSLLQPDHYTVLSLERQQHSAVAPCANIYSNRAPLTSTDYDIPEPALGNLALEPLCLSESHGLTTHHLPYNNLQFPPAMQNRHGAHGDYCIPIFDAPENAVWTTMVQPTIGDHQNQSSQPTIDQQPPLFTQQLPPVNVQSTYGAPFQQYSQYGACINCPSIWRSHFESIMFSGVEDKGISDLKRSYRHLQQHIHEAHQWPYGAGCALCDYLFCFHMGNMVLLEAAKENFTDVKVDLGSSFMNLREHIQEAHGGC